MKHIVFDLGQVLIHWDPVHAFSDHFDDHDATRQWFDKIGFNDWNRAQDGGRSFADGLAHARKQHGDLADPLTGYLNGFPHTITQPVPGTWELADELKASGHRLFAITNWGAETWDAATRQYPRLLDLFEDIVISGVEGILKPEAAIYLRLCERNGLRAEDCIFIDDSRANADGARQVGMDGIHFSDAAQLREDLRARGIG
ncbi:HAD family phosphatase [Paracoccus caeni]|uniref:HAD family phosphatase n=1 Tax=Paracoccus caeni TaxID=657651 RepID=A0A934SDP6_9RHOB|nr:HAD family phosphatase [Paracoccus caeni]MBK4215798.1 HAD family phosphatase [Paracoccus caeni]